MSGLNWMKWVGKIVIGTALVTVLTLSITWYTVNMVVQEALQQFNLQGVVPEIKLTDVVSRLINGPQGGQTSSNLSSKTKKPISENVKGSTNTGGTSESQGQAQISPSPSPGKSDDAVSVWSQINGGRANGSSNQLNSGMMMSIEDFTKKKDQMSNEDKMKIFSTIVSRVPENEIQRLSTLVENGITADEAKEMETILRKYLKPAEYTEIITIITKK
ncbi:hypothetical protein [Paenibacillus sp. KN14-4R]|uniref:hypothetical protein n=1 Tax=Paenibacillus sp. KN14-4R TaxID=3445773 RepID=UPI003FA147F6